jgi:hypothetical protein
MVGRKLPLSNLKNIPMFTFSPRTDLNRKQVISSKHLVDMLGRDSPGVGAYKYDFDKLSRSVLNAANNPKKPGLHENYSFGSTEKFFELKAIVEQKQEK